ncbi:MAG TPA: NUDIX domain-containing protein [Candidatus Acidoferrum sp.]|nr:NUDIX domain-containing protein [Candidatus Acidoferrum sp.]
MDERQTTMNAIETASAAQPRVGVGVLLVDEVGRVLLTLRKNPPEADCWSIVGGKLDFLEALEHCAVRETLEEVGLQIAIDGLLCVTDHLLPHENQHWVSPAYLGRILSGEASNREPHKTREVRWFALNELPLNLTMTARNVIETFRRGTACRASSSSTP